MPHPVIASLQSAIRRSIVKKGLFRKSSAGDFPFDKDRCTGNRPFAVCDDFIGILPKS